MRGRQFVDLVAPFSGQFFLTCILHRCTEFGNEHDGIRNEHERTHVNEHGIENGIGDEHGSKTSAEQQNEADEPHETEAGRTREKWGVDLLTWLRPFRPFSDLYFTRNSKTTHDNEHETGNEHGIETSTESETKLHSDHTAHTEAFEAPAVRSWEQ